MARPRPAPVQAGTTRRIIRSGLSLLPYVGFLAVLAAFTLVPAGSPRYITVIAVASAGFDLLGVVFSLRAARTATLTSAARRPWWFIAGYFVLSQVTGVSYGLAAPDRTLHASPTLVLAVVARIASIAVLATAILLFARRPMDPRARNRFVTDIAVVTGCGTMLLWYLLIGPALPLVAGAGVAAAATRLSSAGFAITDLVLVLCASAVLLRGVAATERRPLVLVLTGVTVQFVVDLYAGYQLLTTAGTGVTALTIPMLILPRMFVLSAAVEQRSVATGVDPVEAGSDPSGRPDGWLPYLALALGIGLLVTAAIRSPLYPWGGLAVSACIMTGGVVARQVLALRENKELLATDPLTGLANRVRLHQALDRAVERGRTGRQVAVMLIDLNGFKQVNDAYGHETGDAVLVAFADVLRKSVRRTDTAARIGGDEFAVVLAGVTGSAEATAVAERILRTAEQPTVIAGHPMTVRASIGIAVTDPTSPETSPDELLHHADLAMYGAKRRRASGWQLHAEDDDPADREAAREADRETARLATELRAAVDAGELRVLYQPIVAVADGTLAGFEALVRWQHPTRGLLSPGEFVPLAERTGVIRDVGRWVLRESCAQVRAWQGRMRSGPPLQLSANVSAVEFDRDDLVPDVLSILDQTGLDPRHLVLELTESAVVDDASAVAALARLRGHGIRIALDDFGTGFSSLRQVAELPVDVLKVDRSFVSGYGGDPRRAAVATAVVRLSQDLGLETVAEGIEEPAQVSGLVALGCWYGQGFHFARPLPPDAVDRLIDGSGGHPPVLPAVPSLVGCGQTPAPAPTAPDQGSRYGTTSAPLTPAPAAGGLDGAVPAE